MSACSEPIPFETLVALWAGELADAERVEEHLFSCDACHAAAESLADLVDAIRRVLPPAISRAKLDRLVAAGARVTLNVVEPAIESTARFAPEIDLLIHVLRCDLANAERVDLEIASFDDAQRIPYEHVPFDRERGEVLIACQRHYEHFAFEPKFRLYAIERGTRRPLGEYVIHHIWR